MEHEGPLPRSQEPSTGPYPDPDQDSSYHPILSPRSILILYTTYVLVFLAVFFILAFPPISSPFMVHALFVYYSLTQSFCYNWRRVQAVKLLTTEQSPKENVKQQKEIKWESPLIFRMKQERCIGWLDFRSWIIFVKSLQNKIWI
jgi:hypothetical protein